MTKTLLAVVAHPDDELSAGGTLAKYAAAGARCVVVCATRGDGRDALIKNEAATRETLGTVRLQELAASCATLGVDAPRCLHYQDGEVAQAPVETAARDVAALIREVRPDLVITHDPGGGYGHPDHIAVCAFTTRAVAVAADPAVALAAPPHAVARLYYFAMPRSFMERVPAFRNRRAEIGGQVLGFVGVPDEAITSAVDVADWLAVKLRALACHRSQFDLDPETGEPKTFTTSVSPEDRLALFGHERFIRAHPAPPAGLPLETDLFAGLD